MHAHSHTNTNIYVYWSSLWSIFSNCSCRTYLRRKSWKLHPCCLHAFPNKRRSCKVLWELFLLGSSQKACYALLSCMAWHVNTYTLFILPFLPVFRWINLTWDFHTCATYWTGFCCLLTGINQCGLWSWSRRWYPSHLQERRGQEWCTFNFGFRDAMARL